MFKMLFIVGTYHGMELSITRTVGQRHRASGNYPFIVAFNETLQTPVTDENSKIIEMHPTIVPQR